MIDPWRSAGLLATSLEEVGMGKQFDRARGALEDSWSKMAHDQGDRTGLSASRIARSLERGVHEDVLALQLNKNQEANNPADPITFTGQEVLVVAKFFAANRSRVAYTGAQAAELDNNQVALENDSSPAQADGALPA